MAMAQYTPVITRSILSQWTPLISPTRPIYDFFVSSKPGLCLTISGNTVSCSIERFLTRPYGITQCEHRNVVTRTFQIPCYNLWRTRGRQNVRCGQGGIPITWLVRRLEPPCHLEISGNHYRILDHEGPSAFPLHTNSYNQPNEGKDWTNTNGIFFIRNVKCFNDC